MNWRDKLYETNDAPIALDAALLKRMSGPINQTWSYIAGDVDEDMSNGEAMELVLDADRLDMTGGDREANALLHRLCAQHGWPTVHKFFTKNIQLV